VTSPPALLARVAPPSTRPSRRARHLIERNLLVYRRIWVVILSGFFEPVFYLLSIGIGVGALVGDLDLPDGRTVSYAAFVAPALLASSAMNGAVFESTFNIFFKLKWGKTYDAILATPMQPGDIALGEITWSLFRGALYAAGFLTVMVAMGLMQSWWGLLALPATILIGFAFGAVGMAATTFMKGWQDFDLVSLVTLPLFLFSATFYPLDVYPPVLQTLTALSPLYHGVVLIRGLTLGALDWSLLGHAGFLVVMGMAGWLVASRRLGKLLLA
jgi:lipooligosaccharide transport system permease protein